MLIHSNFQRLFGSKRTHGGSYNVTRTRNLLPCLPRKVDRLSSVDGTTTAGDANVKINSFLFGQTNLDPSSEHEIGLTNAGRLPDTSPILDFLIWEREIPDDSAPEGIIVNSTNFAFAYFPADSWNRTVHTNFNTSKSSIVTQTQAASANIAFVGSSVALYGSLSPASGIYLCTIDDVSAHYTPVYRQDAVQQVLCFADSLDEVNQHLLTITNTGPGSLSIDHAQFWGMNTSVCLEMHCTSFV